MNMPSEDIKDMLTEDGSLSELQFGENLFIGAEPSTPDNCVTIFDSVGRAPMLTLDKQVHYEYPSIQIRVRNNSYPDGWAQINDVIASLHGRAGEEWNDALYDVIRCTASPAFMAWDDNGRAIFVANFDLQRKEVT